MPPRFWEIAYHAEFGVQAVFGPDGKLGAPMGFLAEHERGRNRRLRPEPSLSRWAQRVLPIFAAAGWRGPLNLQLRRSGDEWLVVEMNPRFSGGTSARYLLGFDEVGWVLNAWLGPRTVPPGPEGTATEVVWLPQEFAL